MNIVDVIKSQLSNEVLGKLSSIIGESEEKTKTAATGTVPALLSVLAHLASSSSGADKVINSLKQVDSGASGGVGDILSGGHGPALEKGGSLLNILLGTSALPGLISMLSKFAGIAAGPAKNLLSLLAPLILSTIAKQFAGRSLTSQALSSFFSEQAPHINAALPSGFSLANIPGFSTTTATTAPRPAVATAPAESSGLPGWLLPLVGLGLLGALAWYFFGTGQPAAEEKPIPETAPVVRREEPKRVEPASTKVELPAVPDTAKLSSDLTGVFTALTDLLGGVKDVATAETVAPKLTDLTPRIDGLKDLWDKVPQDAKGTISKLAVDHLDKLKELVAKILALPGVGDKLKPLVDGIMTKLSAFTMS
jgi:Bacterial protein of unknown function (DUF937)